MRINKFIFSWVVIVFSCIAIHSTAYAANQSDPVALLKYIANNMIAGLKANKATLKTKPQIVYNLAYKYVVPYADTMAMSKQVLSPQVWNSASPQQRMQFQKEFTTTLIRTYASALTSYQDQVVEFYPPRGDYQRSNMVEVNSEISSSQGEPIRVSYRLIRVGSVWRLFDLSVEGVSMLESFRSQFSDILSQGDIDKLLQRMAAHNNRRAD